MLPAGTSGVVTLTYRPDAIYRTGLFCGLAILALMIVLAVPLRRRSKLRSVAPTAPGRFGPVGPAPGQAGERSRLAGLARVPAGLLVVAFGLWTGGYAGAALLPAATVLFIAARKRRSLGRNWRLLSSMWLVPALMLAAAIGQAAGYLLEQWGYSGGGVTALWDTGPELMCLLILGRLIAELAGAGRPHMPGRDSAGPGLADARGRSSGAGG